MRILVLNGSPKGKNSITLQTVHYLQRLYPAHEFETLNVGREIKKLERDFKRAQEALEAAEIILFSYPVYTFLVPCQLHRFIELIHENKVDISGKYASQISTSKHFYDVTAHEFIRENALDLGLKYIRGLSADMEDLLKEEGRSQARDFFDWMLYCIRCGVFEAKKEAGISDMRSKAAVIGDINAAAEKSSAHTAVIVHNCEDDDIRLRSMIDLFAAEFPYEVREVNLKKLRLAGGCLGCLECATDGKCIYKDGFDDFLRNEIQSADAIVYAFAIENHYTHSDFKMYDDRQFCNGHRTVTSGTPFAYLIRGDYSREYNLRTVIEARSEVGGNFLAGVVSDEKDTANDIKALAGALCLALEKGYSRPKSFYGIGGAMIFRDLIYQMQGMMKADHQYYKAHGLYDFPQKQKKTILMMKLVGMMLANKKLKAKMGSKLNEYMLAPYTKVLEDADKKD